MIIDCVSDLHGHYPELEGGDLLIVAGDLTASDQVPQYHEFLDWIFHQKYKAKIVVGGNHDNFLQHDSIAFLRSGFEYLCDSGTEFEYEDHVVRDIFDSHNKSLVYRKKLKIWGSPWTKTFPGMNPKCKAFTCEDEDKLVSYFRNIPSDTDILITHSAPYTIRDGRNPNQNLGSHALLDKLRGIKNLKLHVFGHIHEGYGVMDLQWFKNKDGFNGSIYVNASHVNEHYQPVNKPIRVII